jgi:hypothetical protein
MHDTYRRNFNGVDLFNRDCFGSFSLQKTVLTRSWHRRMFLAILGMCETNAMKAYRVVIGPIQRFEWLVMLADKLINNPFLEEGEATAAAGFSGAAMATPGAGMTPPGSSFA